MNISRRRFLRTAASVSAMSMTLARGEGQEATHLDRQGDPDMGNTATIHNGALSANVSSEGNHGWCGLSNLASIESARDWLLSPALTLEHYIGIAMDAEDYIDYEPCTSVKTLEDISQEGCTLGYNPLPCSQINGKISYEMADPHYVDVSIKVQTSRSDWPLGFLALFFATIVRAPVYSGITLMGHDEGYG